MLFGCASPGPPRPPSLELPEPATLSAERIGGDVDLRFAIPTRTTDNRAIRNPIGVRLCRAVDAGPCAPLASTTLPTPGSPAPPPFEFRDALTPELLAAPARLLTYRVELLGPRRASSGPHSAGPSEPAFAAAGPSLAPVAGLQAESSREGVRLYWQPAPVLAEVLLRRERLTPLAKAAAKQPSKSVIPNPAKEEIVTLLHAAPPREEHQPTPDAGGSLDTTAHFGIAYTYTAYRQSTLTFAGHTITLRSADSAPATINFRNVFPPAAPTGLLAASFTPPDAATTIVDLSWQPNVEDNQQADLAGYNIYRQLLNASGTPSSPLTKLNAKPITLPSYRDATLTPATACRYTVTAVDTAGNESAQSTAAEYSP